MIKRLLGAVGLTLLMLIGVVSAKPTEPVKAVPTITLTADNTIVLNQPFTEQQMREYAMLIQNEYWCDGKACVDRGFADQVANVKCDASLNGTRDEVLKLFFFGRRIEVTLKYAKCPLVTGMLGYDVSVNGTNVFRTDEERKTNSGYNWDRLSDIKPEEMIQIGSAVQKAIKDHTDKTVRPY